MVLARRWAGVSRASRARRDADLEGAARLARSEAAARPHRIVQREQRRMAHVVPQQARPRTDASTQGVERACGGGVVRPAEVAGPKRSRSPWLGPSRAQDDGEGPDLIPECAFRAAQSAVGRCGERRLLKRPLLPTAQWPAGSARTTPPLRLPPISTRSASCGGEAEGRGPP